MSKNQTVKAQIMDVLRQAKSCIATAMKDLDRNDRVDTHDSMRFSVRHLARAEHLIIATLPPPMKFAPLINVTKVVS